MLARFIFTMLAVGASLAAVAAPIQSTASARAGARILAAPVVVETPELPSVVVLTSKDVARGHAMLSVPKSTFLSLAAGDRDVAPPRPARDGVLVIRAATSGERIEIVRHIQ